MTHRTPGVFTANAQYPDDPNLGQESEFQDAVEIKVAGRSNLYIGDGSLPHGSSQLYYFGEQIDETPIISQEFYNDVPGDSHGGPNGPPIDRQVLGRIYQTTFTLSTWSQRVRQWLETHNGPYQIPGYIADHEIGSLLKHQHAFRVLIVPIRDNRARAQATTKDEDYFTFNFPCALISSPIETGQSTKFSTLRFTMEAHRAPPNSLSNKDGVIWDRDITGLSTAIVEPS